MKRGSNDTIVALALGGGLVAIIMAIEARRGRSAAPVITRGTGRWTHVGGDIVEYPLAQMAVETSTSATSEPRADLELLRTIARVLAEYERRAMAEKAAKQVRATEQGIAQTS